MAQETVIIATMGLDQHENGAVAVSRILREAQMKVTYLGRFNTPASVAEAAARGGADVIGVSCHSWEYLDLVPELIRRLRADGVTTPVVIGGSVITAADAQAMRAAGVAAVVNGALADDEIVDIIRAAAAARESFPNATPLG